MPVSRHLVLVGAGHAHLATLAGLRGLIDHEHRVTVVSPAPYHYYSGMGPGVLSGIYYAAEARVHVHELVESQRATFVRDRVVAVDPAGRTLVTESGREIVYDTVSFDVGSSVRTDVLESTDGSVPVLPVKPVANFLEMRRLLTAKASRGAAEVAVVGGGASGVEAVLNMRRFFTDERIRGRITLVPGAAVLPDYPRPARELVQDALRARQIEVLRGVEARRVESGHLSLSDGSLLPVTLVVAAWGVAPSGLFQASGLPVATDGSLLVSDTLQGVGHPEIFGAGDCVSLQSGALPKVGVHAVRQGKLLARNLRAAMLGGRLRELRPKADFLLILNLGDGRGLAVKGERVRCGRAMFWLKDMIDGRHMSRFQLCGEREERGDEVATEA